MRLEFSLLVVDDNPDNIREAIGFLDDYLGTRGFSLKTEKVSEDFSDKGLEEVACSKGRNYDLVMVDFNLGQDGLDGTHVAHRLRQKLPYVDMVFYSSAPVSQLLARLAKRDVSGVFASIRTELDDALVGLADTVIGKAVDLNHMRGIAMAEVAEMDVLMEQTLVRVFQSNNEQIGPAKKRTVKRLKDGMKKNEQQLQCRLDEGGLPAVVNNGLLFSSAHKYRAIKRVAKNLRKELLEELEVVESYECDILSNRNKLAHVKEDTNEGGKTVLRSMGQNNEEVIIDDDWMSDFRQKLRTHRTALAAICRALDSRFGAVEPIKDAKKD